MTKFILLLSSMLLCFGTIRSQSKVNYSFKLYDGILAEDISIVKVKLEGNASRIMSDLNVEYSGTITVHIWKNNTNYLNAQEQHIGMRFPGSTGYVISPNELACLFVNGIEEIAEHEFAHCISLHVQSNFGNNPRWLWEAVAIYESGEFTNPQDISYLKSGNYPTINELNGNFNSGARKIYEVGYLITEFIIHEWGKEILIKLIRNFGNLHQVLGVSTKEFEEMWKDFVNQKYFGITNIEETFNYNIKLLNNLHSITLIDKNNLFTDGTVKIFDVHGEIIFSNKIRNNCTYVNLSNCNKGIYVVVLNNGNILFKQKIVLGE